MCCIYTGRAYEKRTHSHSPTKSISPHQHMQHMHMQLPSATRRRDWQERKPEHCANILGRDAMRASSMDSLDLDAANVSASRNCCRLAEVAAAATVVQAHEHYMAATESNVYIKCILQCAHTTGDKKVRIDGPQLICLPLTAEQLHVRGRLFDFNIFTCPTMLTRLAFIVSEVCTSPWRSPEEVAAGEHTRRRRVARVVCVCVCVIISDSSVLASYARQSRSHTTRFVVDAALPLCEG